MIMLLLLLYSEAVLEPHGLLVSYDLCSPSSDDDDDIEPLIR